MVNNPALRSSREYSLQGMTALSATLALVFFLILSIPVTSLAAVTGPCVNCHTMHNSQGGSAMATYGADGKPWKGTSPLPALTRGTCLGCHGYGGAQKIVTIGGSGIPQVYHTDGSDLAGGNFAYILGAKGSGASDAKGHNVKDIVDSDDVLDAAPGLMPASGHSSIITDTNLTCAGYIGCHGNRYQAIGTGVAALKGAHHGNVDGVCDTADTVANSYRFLLGVKGLENTGASKWQNASSGDHNEYFGATTPMNVSCANTCHLTGGVQPPNKTISGFCATCHGQFHDQTEIGGTSSPFKRHPTDIRIKNEGEYAVSLRTYNPGAPVGRTSVYGAPSSAVTADDVVTCLSCHAAHATNYPDLLRWDYTTMIAGGGSNTTGCFTCHTQKDNP
ncbi:MAG: cytochrome c3 family protein [Thermodesulfobacteriota bacterium]|nr:cytochrome c3 family protein [Thermodesulfobacteriota bacterium]